MAKLTKKQREEIQSALASLARLNQFIDRQEIAFCRVTEINEQVAQGPNDYRARESHRSQHYSGRDGSEWDIHFIKELTPMDKGIGSDLVNRFTVGAILERFLKNNS